jgi:hypothetical protein
MARNTRNDEQRSREEVSMTDRTEAFFDQLGRRGHEPLLERFNGSIRFDLAHGKRTDHVLVAVKKGDINISHQSADADCVVRTDRAQFDRFATGESNLMTAFLRGELALQGDLHLLVLFQRVFPGPASSPDELVATPSERRRS